MTAMNPVQLVPFALKDAPALIETVFPAQKVSFEAQRERKAGAGQTLTALGSYWKGRKPLILVRSIILGSLLPATEDAEKDLELFEALMAFDIAGLGCRSEPCGSLRADCQGQHKRSEGRRPRQLHDRRGNSVLPGSGQRRQA